LAYLAALVCLGACGSGTPSGAPKACTEIGCIDQFSATLATADGALPSGTQTLTVTADGTTVTCSFSLPLATGAGSVPSCPSALQLQIRQASTCMTTDDGTAKTRSCTPVAGQFSEVLTLVGTPAMVHVTQTSADATLVDQTVTPTYTKTQPNGPGCDPICSQAGSALVLAPM
jgi:hypothetical protein